jgi:hypothetical protein
MGCAVGLLHLLTCFLAYDLSTKLSSAGNHRRRAAYDQHGKGDFILGEPDRWKEGESRTERYTAEPKGVVGYEDKAN